MKKNILLFLVVVFCLNFSFAQAPPFAFTSTDGTFVENSAAATLLPLVRADTFTTPNQNIGFTFGYAGTNYTQFKMCSNGFITLNATGTFSTATNDLSTANATGRPIIAPLWDDLDGGTPTTSQASFEVTGTAPNRVLTVEWKNWEWNWNSGVTPVISFQVKLYETTNVVQFVYRQEAGAVASGSASIGLGGITGSGVQSYVNVTNDVLPSVTSAFSVTNIAVKPATGRTYTFTPSACATPVGTVVTNILQQTATLTWTADTPAATGYEYVVQPATATTFGTPAAVATNTVNLTGLIPATIYNVYLRKNCGTDFSGWVMTGTFTTLCNPLTTLPWTENFDSLPIGTNIFPQCWGFANTTSTWFIAAAASANLSGTNSLRRTWSTNGWAFLPVMTLTAGQAYEFSYWMRTADANGVYSIVTAVGSGQSAAAMTTTLNSSTGYNSPVWTKFIYTFTPTVTGSYSFGLQVSADGVPNGINFDDLKVAEVSTCPEPTALIVTGITSVGGQIDFTEPAVPAVAGYDYIITVNNAIPAVTATPTGSVMAGLNSANFSGLTPNTRYFIWVRSKCAAGVKGPWSDPTTFLTNCSDETIFSQNFDASTLLPSCWKKLGPGGTGSISTTAATSAPNSLLLGSSGTTVATQGLIIMPPVSNAGAGTHRLVFRARSQFTVGGVIQVGYVTDNFDANSFTSVQTFTTTSTTTFDSFSAILGTAPGANKFLAFRHAGAPNTNAVLIDNISWELIPTCLEPTLVVASAVTAGTATISWTEPLVPAANGYQYFLSTTNTAPSSASVATGAVAGGVATLNLATLLPQTNYFIWIRSVCSTSDSSAWTLATSFRTLCLPVATLPWTENFDTTATGTNSFPPCWGFENITSTWAISTTPSPAFSGANLLRRTWSTNGWAFTPTITLTAGTSYEFSYWMRANDTTAPGYTIQTAVGLGQNAASMVTTIDTKTGYVNAVWTRINTTFIPTVTGNYSFGVRAEVPTSEPNGINFDDFRVQLSPTCTTPSNVVTSAVTVNTATVSWTAPITAPANGYQYFLSTVNTAPNAASVATAATAASITTVNLTGLTDNTAYFVWVRSSCSVTSTSEWTAVTTFRTLCLPVATLPWTENFDTTLTGTNVFPPCWGFQNITNTWAISTTPSPAFSGANLLRRSWSTNGWAFTPTMALTAGTSYEFSYWMRANDNTAPGYTIQTAVGLGQTAASMVTTLDTKTGYVNAVWTRVVTNFVPSVTGNYSFGVRAEVPTSEPNGINFDDFRVQLSPSCISPSGVVSSAITTTTATVSWTAPVPVPANGYQYFVSTVNTAPSAASVATGSVAASPTSVNLTGLIPATNYFVWIRSACSSSDLSQWTAVPLLFQTSCSAESVPTALQSVEGTIGTDLPTCWTAALVSGTNNWIGYTPTGEFDEISTPVTGTRTFRKDYNSSDALLFSNPLSYVGVTDQTRVSVFLQRGTQADINDQYKIFVNTSKSLTGAVQILNIFLKNDIAPVVAAKGFYNYKASIPASFNGQAQVFVIIQGTTTGGFASYSLGVDDFRVEIVPCTGSSAVSPPTAVAQSFCNSGTVANLVAVGTGIQWYAAASGGVALTATTALATGNYFASQTVGPCESVSRTSVAVTISATAAPTAVAQSFCNTGTVANLVATGTGTINWYATATATVALAPTTPLVAGNYFASQTIGTCESVSRTSVAVTINTTVAPTAVAQSFCNTGTVANLVATGTGTINWYATATATVALAPTTPLVAGNYFASQTIGTCESVSRTSVAVTISAPVAPTAVAQTICNTGTVANLVATGTGIKWYATATATVALTATTPLVTGNYFASQTIGTCESVSRTSVAVTVSAVNAPTGVATQNFTVPSTIANLVAVGTNVVWFSSIANAQANTNPLVATTALVDNTTYFAMQTVGSCRSAAPLAVLVTISLGTNAFEMNNLEFYPNPVNNKLTLKNSNPITSIEVFNLLGQRVSTARPNSLTTQLDMSNLQAGSYLIKVTADSQVKTIKVVKE